MNRIHSAVPPHVRLILEAFLTPDRPKSIDRQNWLAQCLHKAWDLEADPPDFRASTAAQYALIYIRCNTAILSCLTEARDGRDERLLRDFWKAFSQARHRVGLVADKPVQLGDYTALFFTLIEAICRASERYEHGSALSRTEQKKRLKRIADLSKELHQLVEDSEFDVPLFDAFSTPPDWPGEDASANHRQFVEERRLLWWGLRSMPLPVVTVGDVLSSLAQIDTSGTVDLQPRRVNQEGAMVDAITAEIALALDSVKFEDRVEITLLVFELLLPVLQLTPPSRERISERLAHPWESTAFGR